MIIQIQTPLNVFYNTLKPISKDTAHEITTMWGPSEYVFYREYRDQHKEVKFAWAILPRLPHKAYWKLATQNMLGDWHLYWTIHDPIGVVYDDAYGDVMHWNS